MNNHISSKDKFITEHTYKAMGFTKPEIEKLQNAYPSKNPSREEEYDYQEILSNTLKDSASRNDNKHVACGFLSGISSLSFLALAKAAHAYSEPKALYTCIGLSIVSALYSAFCFKNIEKPFEDLEQKFKKAEQKAKVKWEKLAQKTKERTR